VGDVDADGNLLLVGGAVLFQYWDLQLRDVAGSGEPPKRTAPLPLLRLVGIDADGGWT
jgi:hypothetical protein